MYIMELEPLTDNLTDIGDEIYATAANLSANSSSSFYYGESSDYFYDLVWEMVYPQTYEWVILGFFMLLLVLALGGNSLVVYAVMRNEHMRSVTNYYIVNLSAADILVSLICFGPTAVGDVTETWWLGDTACKLIPYFQVRPPLNDHYRVKKERLKYLFKKKSSQSVLTACLNALKYHTSRAENFTNR